MFPAPWQWRSCWSRWPRSRGQSARRATDCWLRRTTVWPAGTSSANRCSNINQTYNTYIYKYLVEIVFNIYCLQLCLQFLICICLRNKSNLIFLWLFLSFEAKIRAWLETNKNLPILVILKKIITWFINCNCPVLNFIMEGSCNWIKSNRW